MKYFQRIILDDIYCLQASGNQTVMVFIDGKQNTFKLPISYFDKIIESNSSLVKIHKHYIVNRNLIKEINLNSVLMQDGRVFPKKVGFAINTQQ